MQYSIYYVFMQHLSIELDKRTTEPVTQMSGTCSRLKLKVKTIMKIINNEQK